MKSRLGRWHILLMALAGFITFASNVTAQIQVENFDDVFTNPATNVHTLADFTVGPGDDRKLVVAFNAESALQGPTNVTYGGVALTKAADFQANRTAEIWYLDNPAVGTADIQLLWSGNARSRMGALSLQNAKPGFSVENATGGAGVTNITLTTTNDNTFVVGCYTENNGAPAITSGPFATQLYAGDGGSCKTDAGYQNEEIAGLKTYTWVAASVGGSGIAVAGFEGFVVVPPHVEPYADSFDTLGLWHMETIRDDKYMDDDDSAAPGRNADWVLQPNETNAPPMVSIVDPVGSIGYPADNAAFGNCLYFPASTPQSGGALPYSKIPNFDITNARIEGWCKEDGVGNDATPMLFDRWGQIYFALTETGFKMLAFEAGGLGNNTYTIDPAGFSPTNWNHWAVEFSAQSAKVFVNGTLESTISLPAGLNAPTKDAMYFGKRYNGASPFNFKGWMDEVRISIPVPVYLTYSDWANLYGLTGSDTNLDADLEFGGLGDGLMNMQEWALGGNPFVDDAASVSPAANADASEFSMSYNRLRGADALGITYTVETATDLLSGDWTNAGIIEVTTFAGLEYEVVTNTVPADTDTKFMRLTLESGPQPVTPPEVDPSAWEIPQAATTPTIDGTLSGGEYSDAIARVLEYPAITNLPGWGVKYQLPTNTDFSATYYLKWDETYLYVAVDVVDDLTVFSEGAGAYPNDHLNIAVNPFTAGTVSGDIAFYEMYRIETNGAVSTAVQYRDATIPLNPAYAPDNVVIASSTTASGYVIEAAFAWADLGLVPAVDQKHGILLFPADKDVDTPDFGNIAEGEPGSYTGTFFWDAGGGSSAPVETPQEYNTVTLGSAL